MKGRLTLDYRSLDELLQRRYEFNPKSHDEDGITNSIKRYDFNAAPTLAKVAGEAEKLVAGHGRLEALEAMRRAGSPAPGHVELGERGEWMVPVVCGVEFATVDEFEEYLVTDNATTLARAWVDERIAPMLKRMQERKVPLTSLSWRKEQVAVILQRLRRRGRTEDPGPDMDAAAKLQEEWKVARGQAWIIEGAGGAHRLMCGDSRSPDDVARLVVGLGDFLFTSPPYNVDVQYGEHDDREMPRDQYLGWLREVVDAWVPHLAQGRALAWNAGARTRTGAHRHAVMLEDAGLTFLRQFVWEKSGVPTPTWYHTRNDPRVRRLTSNFKHEMVYLLARGELELGDTIAFDFSDAMLQHDIFEVHQTMATRDLPSGRSRTGAGNVNNLDRRARKAHPAPFPTQVPGGFIDHLTGPGEVVLEPFSGSGSTIVAAEERGRVGYGMEIDPTYCAVALDRLRRMGMVPRLEPHQ